MIIQAKGTRREAETGDPAERYLLSSTQRKSKVPFGFALALTGLMLYLKSFLPSAARTVDDEADQRQPVAVPDENAPNLALVARQDLPADLDMDPVGTTPPHAAGPTGAGGRLIELQPSWSFDLMEETETAFVFEAASYGGLGRAVAVMPPQFAAADNDNRASTGPAQESGPPLPRQGGEVERPLPPLRPRDDKAVPAQGKPQLEHGNDRDEESVGGTLPDEDGTQETPDDRDPDTRPANRAPQVRGPVYLMDVTGCAVLLIGLDQLLEGAFDPDGDRLAVEDISISSGSLTRTADGWLFTAEPYMLGPVTISYRITDGELGLDQTAQFSVVRSFIGGTANDDMLLGTMCADDIDGGDGDDNIDARAGDDVISGGSGDDHIVAGAGNDVIFGGKGNDIIFAGAGDDHVSGGAGDDRIYGEAGDDVLFGDDGNDIIEGGDGRDLIDGGAGDDTLDGGDGDDVIAGGVGDDILSGGAGDDVLIDGDGSDRNAGGAGNDTIVVALDGANDRHDGGEGFDTLDLSGTTLGVSVSLAASVATGTEIGTDAIASFEAVIGGSGADRLEGADGAELLAGGAGDDTIVDGAGADTNLGGDGDDLILAALDGASDRYDGGAGHDTLDYSATTLGVCVDTTSNTATGIEVGRDTVTGFESFVGGTGDDHFIVGSETPVVLMGGDGDDTFEFPPDPQPVARVTHEILDFHVGDRIRMSRYDIFEEVLDELEDRFERIYDLDDDEFDDDDFPIRFSHDRNDDMDQTIVEADFNRDDIFETTITLRGHHALVVIEHA